MIVCGMTTAQNQIEKVTAGADKRNRLHAEGFSKKGTRHTGCPACSHKIAHQHNRHTRVYQCGKCTGIFGDLYLGDSYNFVLPRMTNDPAADTRHRYFDFTTLGSEGVSRRHGWFDPETKLITQIG